MSLHFINGHRFTHKGAEGHERLSGYESQLISEWEYANSLHLMLKTPYRYSDAFNLDKVKEYITDETLALEFHLNSFNSPDIHGYEVLVLEDDTRSVKYANYFLQLMEKNFPLRRNRGIKFISRNDRGYNNLLRLKQYYKQAIITEAFFLSNPEDWIPREEIAEVINALTDCMGNEGKRL